jgi:hypothetical protein
LAKVEHQELSKDLARKKKRREDSHYREMLSLQNILQKKSITN